MQKNLVLSTDSYKLSHYKQYPPGTRKVYSYLESRGGMFPKTLFFGLQYIIKEYLISNGDFRKPFDLQDINDAEMFAQAHFGKELFNYGGWQRLLEKHNGNLPLKIKAVREGTLVDTSNVLMTVENTDEEFPWLVNYLETLLMQVWYPITVATQSFYIKKIILDYLKKTGTPEQVDFKLHDFGFRGVSSYESAAIGGMAHLVNFKGTDTIAGIIAAKDYYNTDVCGFSIPASEHSTITSWGKDEEIAAFDNMLRQYPDGLVACVSDSFDIYAACDHLWGDILRDKILARNGTLVIRPDSGDALEVLPKCLNILWGKFGGYMKKGYRVLNDKIRLIQGDGVDYDSIQAILAKLTELGWSTDNIAFGMGGALLQKLNRDTQKMAFKCSAIKINNEIRPVFKTPVTDSGKNSKQGILALRYNSATDKYHTVENAQDERSQGLIKTVFENGALVNDITFEEVRNKANSELL